LMDGSSDLRYLPTRLSTDGAEDGPA